MPDLMFKLNQEESDQFIDALQYALNHRGVKKKHREAIRKALDNILYNIYDDKSYAVFIDGTMSSQGNFEQMLKYFNNVWISTVGIIELKMKNGEEWKLLRTRRRMW